MVNASLESTKAIVWRSLRWRRSKQLLSGWMHGLVLQTVSKTHGVVQAQSIHVPIVFCCILHLEWEEPL